VGINRIYELKVLLHKIAWHHHWALPSLQQRFGV